MNEYLYLVLVMCFQGLSGALLYIEGVSAPLVKHLGNVSHLLESIVTWVRISRGSRSKRTKNNAKRETFTQYEL